MIQLKSSAQALIHRTPVWAAAVTLTALPLFAMPLGEGDDEEEQLEAFRAEVELYQQHVASLADPVMGGRLPGTAGMEMAKAYMEHHFRMAGLAAPFDYVVEGPDGQELTLPAHSYRQPFELAGTSKLVGQAVELPGGSSLEAGTDFGMLSLGNTGDVTAPLVYVGYSINRGQSGYKTYGEDDDLTGKIAVMMRFEPMDAEGKSLWGGSPWTARASFDGKVRAAVSRGAVGVIIVQTPGAADERVNQLLGFRSGGARRLDGPVAMITTEAGQRMLTAIGATASLEELRDAANAGGGIQDLGGSVRMMAEIERKPVIAENVAGLVPGKGELADEVVVIGAHLDHLGNGDFGSRARSEERGQMHPGADDNASGSAALLLLGQRLKADFDALPADASVRSVLLIGFSAEESGLHGASHYVEEPIAPLEAHQLMINFDMIGRITNGRLSVSNGGSGKGLQEFLAPFFERTPLEIVAPEGMSGGSDHLSFLRKGVPSLFGIIADFHDDYHTPRDTIDKINHEDAVHTVELFHQIALGAAINAERFDFVEQQRGGRRSRAAQAQPEPNPEEPAAGEQPTRATIKVRFGIQPASYSEDEAGVGVTAVTKGTSADLGGIQAGDRLLRWNGEEIDDVMAWMGMLANHEPGDVVKVSILREGEEKVLPVTLQGKETDGR